MESSTWDALSPANMVGYWTWGRQQLWWERQRRLFEPLKAPRACHLQQQLQVGYMSNKQPTVLK